MSTRSKTWIGSLLGAAMLALAAASPASAAFSEPQALSPAGFTGSFPAVGLAPDGTATVAWSQYENPLPVSGQIPYMVGATRIDGDGTAGSLQVYGDGAGPLIAVDRNGNATTVWMDCTGKFPRDCSLRYIRANPDGTIGPIEMIETGPGSRAVAGTSDGRVLVAWTVLRGSAGDWTESVEAAWISADGMPGEPFVIARTEKELSDLVLSIDAKDRAVLAWRAWRNDGLSWPSVRAAVIKPDGTVGSDLTVIGSERRRRLDELALSGDRLVTLRERTKKRELRRSILLSTIRANGTASKPTRIATPRRLGDYVAPQIETAVNGRSIVAWNDRETIRATAIGRDGTASAPVAISGEKGAVRGVDLAMAPDGRAVAAWKRGMGWIEIARFGRRGRPASPELAVKREKALQRPVVALDDQDRVTLLWEEDGRVLHARGG